MALPRENLERRVVLNADDFGLSVGTNEAIVDLCRARSLNSTTLLTNLQAFEHAVDLARDCPELSVGLHFTLTIGSPVADSMTRLMGGRTSGVFPARARLLKGVTTGLLPRSVLREEARAQLDRLVASGVTPTHIDSHQHVHSHPLIFDTLAELAEDARLALRVPFRWRGPVRQPFRKRVKGLGTRLASLRNYRKWMGRVKMNANHCSIFDVGATPANLDLGAYHRLLDHGGARLEIMLHPSKADPVAAQLVSITELGRAEYELLQKHSLTELAMEYGYKVVRFHDL